MREIEYDKENIIDSETLNNADKNFVFTTTSKTGNGESMTIKHHKDDVNDFRIVLFGLKNLKDIEEAPPAYTDARVFDSPSDTNDEGQYKIYTYRYNKLLSNEAKYLYISVYSLDNADINYFSFTLNSAPSEPSSYSSGLSFGIISLIIILSLL